MKYFLIAGEASGDLHAANLMRAIKEEDAEAEFQYYGGDLMRREAEGLLVHYKTIAYMGIIPVLKHLPQILRGMKNCKDAILNWRPDCVILVDYPGFNLDIAKFVHSCGICPVYYYISPKIWAWKEHRIHSIRRYIDRLFSILPFEVDFFKRHDYDISYVGNPTVDEVAAFRETYTETLSAFAEKHGLEAEKPIIALLSGSRRQEIKDNLRRMVLAAQPFVKDGYQIVVAGAPSITDDYYTQVLNRLPDEVVRPTILHNATYELLSHSKAALVTSGTATLETALFNVPQVVCYYIVMGRFFSLLRQLVLKVKYISLVNLVCDREVVTELVAHEMNVPNVQQHLTDILPGGRHREKMLQDYRDLSDRLGAPGAPQRAAHEIVELLRQH